MTYLLIALCAIVIMVYLFMKKRHMDHFEKHNRPKHKATRHYTFKL